MTIEALRARGHEVLDLHDSTHKGIKDQPVWQLAQNDQRVLVTTDKGFAKYREENHFGIMIVKLRQPNALRLHDRILSAFSEFQDAEWPGLLVVLRDSKMGVWRSKSTG